MLRFCFFFNAPATTEIYTLSLHDALPILSAATAAFAPSPPDGSTRTASLAAASIAGSLAACPIFRMRCHHFRRSEEHTSELQSRHYLVCRLLLDKKKHHNI